MKRVRKPLPNRSQYFNFILTENRGNVCSLVPSCFKAEGEITLDTQIPDVLSLNVQKFFLPTGFVPFYLFELPPQEKVLDNRYKTQFKIRWYTKGTEEEPSSFIEEEYIYFTPAHQARNPPFTTTTNGLYQYQWDDPYFYVLSAQHLIDTINENLQKHNCNLYFSGDGLLRLDFYGYDEDWEQVEGDIPHFPKELYPILGKGFSVMFDEDGEHFTMKIPYNVEYGEESISQVHQTLEAACVCKQILFTLNGLHIEQEHFPNADDADVYQSKSTVPIFASFFPIASQLGDTQSNVIYTCPTPHFGEVYIMKDERDDTPFTFYKNKYGFKWVDAKGRIHDLYIPHGESAWVKIGVHTL